MTTPHDEGALIADLPDLRIEVSHSEDMVILQQGGHTDEADRIAVHRWHVPLIAEALGIRQELNATAQDQLAAERERTKRAEAMVATLKRRMLFLKERIEHLDEGLWGHPDPERADVVTDRMFSDATSDFAREFCLEFDDGKQAVTEWQRPSAAPVGAGPLFPEEPGQ
ncbi:hypothetical protein [Variovorax sp. JS1663]|uniref:hypothetical protein n=1 Tax=Variovorax sp. JS1663 TaxID=1851577 RepID=UPI000B342EAB|nr:hypothetical protein [Variovorax sp. JS1663]OUM01654.1 hypothetical protein A8M77_15385 [Variovorax sp. JS1663]